MSTNIRSSNIATGAAAVNAKQLDASELKASLEGLSKHSSLILALSFVFGLYFLKGPLIAFIDHEISEISVQGNLKHLSPEAISGRVTPWLDSSFLTTDLNQMKEEVQSLPWVYDTTLTRVWPGKVEVFAVEQVPVAIWNKEHYLNEKGDVYSPEVLSWESPLPSIFGPEESTLMTRLEIMAQLNSLDSMLSEHGYRVGALRLQSRGSWDMVLEDGVQIALGASPFEEKVKRIVAVLNGASQETIARMAVLDARYPNGVAIRWKDDDKVQVVK